MHIRSFLKPKLALIWLLTLPWILGVSSCPNALSEFANKKSDDALLFDAKTLIDKKSWTSAISKISEMTSDGQAKHATKIVLASAYAGRCGLDLVTLAEAISNDLSSKNLWPILMEQFNGVTYYSDCKLAETTVLSVDSTELTDDDYVFLAFVEFAKMGAVLAASGANSGGSISASFNACTNDTADITDADVEELGTGVTLSYLALTNAGSAIASSAISTVKTLCTTIDTSTGTSGFCDKTSTSSFSAAEVEVLRAMIKSNELGFNTCSGAVLSSASCTCP